MISIPTKTNPTFFYIINHTRYIFVCKELFYNLFSAISRTIILNNIIINIPVTRFQHSTNCCGLILEHSSHYYFTLFIHFWFRTIFTHNLTLLSINSKISLLFFCSFDGEYNALFLVDTSPIIGCTK